MKTNRLPLLLSSAFCGLYPATQAAAETLSGQPSDDGQGRPNILWLTFEDTSSYEFGCYGNRYVHTPNIDSLASQGVQFMNVWSCGPQSSPARSSLITGCYATTYGMDVHPVPVDTPEGIFFPQLLRDAGYYCTNNKKTHYNSRLNNKKCWDECTAKASYNSQDRAEGQPFFAVFNSVVSHMSCVATYHTEGRRDYTQEGIYPDRLELPSYVPDLPEVRLDYAGHLESVQDIDKWVGFFLDDLKAKGLDDDTIIFVFSDHGGCVPRGKGYLYESGLRVPLVVYFPEKWKHLAADASADVPVKDGRLVNFTDLGPTVLSLAGVEPPARMQGKALFGKYGDDAWRTLQFAFAANQLHHFMPVRAVTDGRYKYIRSYMPYRQFALRNYFQWRMPSNRAWDESVLSGSNTNPAWELTFKGHPSEMLFDLSQDPGEINDLSSDPACQNILARMREALASHIRQTSDLGFFPPDTRKGRVLYDDIHSGGYDLEALQTIAEIASLADAASVPALEKAIASELPEIRFWGAVGFAVLAVNGIITDCPESLEALLDDSNPYTAAEAAYAVAYLGKPGKGIVRLVNPVNEADRKIGYSALECISLDPAMRDAVREFLPELKLAAETLPRVENEDAGLMARGILVNLGEMDIWDLHGPESYQKGLELNHGRRPMNPRP
ncbi:MAG: sulfatase [Candidatus Cryptobacteroides sp.]